MKIGEIYRPSDVSFEDKDTRLVVDAIRCGRVEYTNLITKEHGEISIDDFGRYYDKVESEEMNGYMHKTHEHKVF